MVVKLPLVDEVWKISLNVATELGYLHIDEDQLVNIHNINVLQMMN